MQYKAFSVPASITALVVAALLSFPVIAAPASGVDIRWNKDITLSGTYFLSTLVNRKAKTFGWSETIWYSPPVFAGFEIVRREDKYFFAGGNLHEEVVWFQIVGDKLEGNPCDPPGHDCISRIQVIDKDTFTILVNGKEENTYYRVNGMTQVNPDEDVVEDVPSDEKAVEMIASYYKNKQYDGNKRVYDARDIGNKYIDSDYVPIKHDKMERLNAKALRNEIYARYGRVFTTPEMRKIFEATSWYRPKSDFKESALNDIEKKNVEFISEFEKKKGWK